MSAAFEIKLDHPVEHTGVMHRSITIRPPPNKDFKTVRKAHDGEGIRRAQKQKTGDVIGWQPGAMQGTDEAMANPLA